MRNRRLALDATKTLLAQREATITVEAIARQAGLGAATVVRAFGNKEALVDAAVADLLDPFIQRARDTLSEPDPEQALRALLLDLIEFQSAHWIIGEQLRGLTVPLTTARRAVLRQTLDDLVAWARENGVVRDDIDATVVAMLLGEVSYAIARSDEASPRLTESFITVIMDGLRPHQ
ncbi:TetR/AcrR family transcriptional regulator [Actinoallomurus liliacearum]|uniref:TetR/AcrR family transcriptional regulator n=1 Tax=Actinoallomurus liliacearum TaxID=1080073 RepID=A0ABP8TWM7_9ACTN